MSKPIDALRVAVAAISVSLIVYSIFPVVPKANRITGNAKKQIETFVNSLPVTVGGLSNSCSVFVSIPTSSSDVKGCPRADIRWTYKIDEGPNNSFDFTGSCSSFSRAMGRGSHRVMRGATDDCGQIASGNKNIQVRDCKAPTGIVLRGPVANLTAPSGTASMNARLFNNGSTDNYTPASLFRFSYAAITTDTLRTNDYSISGQIPVQRRVSVVDGNQPIVNTNVVVQDNNKKGEELHRISLAGTVRTVDFQPLPETKIMVEGGETYLDQMTNEEGKFCFQNLGMFNDYSVVGEKMEKQMRGISTLDLVLLQRHIMQIEKFNDPFSLLAGDVDDSGKIDSLDLVSLRKFILGTLDEVLGIKTWKFVREDQTFIDPENPWMENMAFEFQNMDTSCQNANFTGIKTGDVNHSYSKDTASFFAENRVNIQAEYHVEDILLQKDKVTSVSFIAKNLKNIIAQQFTLEITNDVDYVGFEAVKLPLTVEQIAHVKKNGKSYITCAFHSSDALEIQDGDVLFNLLFQAKSDIQTSRILTMNDDITPGKVYTNDKGKKPLELFLNSQRKPETALVKQNIPNPFKEETTLEYILTNRAPVQFTIYDGAGQMVHKAQMEGNPGLNSIPIGQKELGNARGVLFVKIKSEELNEVVRMLRIE